MLQEYTSVGVSSSVCYYYLIGSYRHIREHGLLRNPVFAGTEIL